MTPKEEALELVDKYSTYVVMWAGGIETSKQNVKQCAIIAVDELISSHNKYDDNTQSNSEEYYFYSEVKKEIEKL